MYKSPIGTTQRQFKKKNFRNNPFFLFVINVRLFPFPLYFYPFHSLLSLKRHPFPVITFFYNEIINGSIFSRFRSKEEIYLLPWVEGTITIIRSIYCGKHLNVFTHIFYHDYFLSFFPLIFPSNWKQSLRNSPFIFHFFCWEHNG